MTLSSRAARAVASLTLLLTTAAVLVAGPAVAVPDAPPPPSTGGAGDYQQVVDLTFPFAESVRVRYRDDYHDRRTSSRLHQSTDLMVPLGTPVHAAMGGTVAWTSGSEAGPPSYGWMVRVQGDDGRVYAYIHLGTQDGPRSRAYAPGIERGARVERGALLGYAGCSGSASCGGGEHLHFEIHDPSVQDPYDYHDHERINPFPSLRAAEARGDYPYDGPFRDVGLGDTHGRDISRLAAAKVTTGCGSNRYCPDAVVTRQQMASFLVRALGLPAAPARRGFADVGSSNVHGADILSLAAAGITTGCSATEFCPGAPVTRAQMASFLVRAKRLPAAPTGVFSDVPTANSHARDIAALEAAGITTGCGGGRYCPDGLVTRAQMASFLVRAFEL